MILEEGSSKIEIPGEELTKGPGTRRAGFYNPDQVLNRDITISLLSVLKPRAYLDGFGGTGIRGIRVALETGIHPVVSEINSKSVEIISRNREINGVDMEIHNEPFESVVSRFLFDFIDVDPYGSIVPFLDVALTHVRNGGYIGLTATDLSALTGSAPGKTRRRYNAFISNDRLRHESGIRLLISYVASRAAAMDKQIMPIVSFWKSHYYRIVVRVKHGAGLADEAIGKIGMLNKTNDVSKIYKDLDEGPLWRGSLMNHEILDNALNNRMDSISMKTYEFLQSLKHEDEMFYFYELSDFASHFGRSLPPLSGMRDSIERECGKPAYRTHFSNTGLKSGLTGEEFAGVFEKISTR